LAVATPVLSVVVLGEVNVPLSVLNTTAVEARPTFAADLTTAVTVTMSPPDPAVVALDNTSTVAAELVVVVVVVVVVEVEVDDEPDELNTLSPADPPPPPQATKASAAIPVAAHFNNFISKLPAAPPSSTEIGRSPSFRLPSRKTDRSQTWTYTTGLSVQRLHCDR
jgi:hypothetical protein